MTAKKTRRQFLLGTTALAAVGFIGTARPSPAPDPNVWHVISLKDDWKTYTIKCELRVADDPASQQRLAEELAMA